jgi:ATP-dependent DNA helicase RecG
MSKVNLTSPLIESDRVKDEFTLTLLVHHLLGEEDLRWLARFRECDLTDDDARALVILREIAVIDNATYRSVNKVDALTASGRLRRLRDLGLLEQHGNAATTCYSAGPRFLEAPTKTEKRAAKKPLRKELPEGLRRELEALRRELPDNLRSSLDSLGSRIPPETLNEVILDLCNWKPLGLHELGILLGKNPTHLQTRNIKRLLADKRLVYQYPDQINHPHQKYVAGDFG